MWVKMKIENTHFSDLTLSEYILIYVIIRKKLFYLFDFNQRYFHIV